MSTVRVSPDAGWVDAKKLPRGPNGRALCRNCQTEVPKGRRTFCGEWCVDDWATRHSPTLMRQRVFRRDKGVCALCGVDTAQLGRDLMAKWQTIKRGNTPELLAARKAFEAQYPWYLGRQTYWDADHIVPVVEGGGECSIDNIRTLCISCHRVETAKLAARRAEQRKMARERERGLQRLF